MSSSFKVIVPPTVEPITLDDVKQYLVVDFPDFDALIARLITNAREYVEHITGRALATQTIQEIKLVERPEGGDVSGVLSPGPNWYQFQQMLGANPFGPAQYYHDLSVAPIQADQAFTAETKITAFDTWVSFPLVTNTDGSANYWIDDNPEPSRLYLRDPFTVNFWRFTYVAGYTGAYIMPPGLRQCLKEIVAFWFQFREGEDLPQALMNKMLAYRINNIC